MLQLRAGISERPRRLLIRRPMATLTRRYRFYGIDPIHTGEAFRDFRFQEDLFLAEEPLRSHIPAGAILHKLVRLNNRTRIRSIFDRREKS